MHAKAEALSETNTATCSEGGATAQAAMEVCAGGRRPVADRRGTQHASGRMTKRVSQRANLHPQAGAPKSRTVTVTHTAVCRHTGAHSRQAAGDWGCTQTDRKTDRQTGRQTDRQTNGNAGALPPCHGTGTGEGHPPPQRRGPLPHTPEASKDVSAHRATADQKWETVSRACIRGGALRLGLGLNLT